MELSLTREKLNYAENVLSDTRTAEEAMEIIVPDALPDILRLIGADAEVFVRSKDTSAGRVTVSGTAAVTVVYVPDGDAGLRRVNLELPYSISAEDPRVTAASRVTARVNLRGADASVLNPRKIAVRAAVTAELRCYNDAELDVPVGLEPNANADIELLPGEAELSLATDVREKAFVVSDEYQVPASNPPVGEILKSNVALIPEDTKVVGSKLIFRGTARVALLYASGDGEAASCAFETEFSQILELENAGADSEFEIIPLLTGAYIEADASPGGDARRVTAELHLAAQCVARSKRRLVYIGDAYCSKYGLETSRLPLVVENSLGERAVSGVLRGTLDAPDISRVISVSARPGTPEHAVENGELALRCPVTVNALYAAGDGSVRATSGSFDLDASIPDANASNRYATRAELTQDIYGVANENGIELRIPVDIRADETERGEYSPISAVSYDEENPLDLSNLPSLVISRAAAGDTLWNLAKRYHSTRELILQANGLEDEDAVADAEMLIIPKKR
ncbi:MAG: DUF3794 domain-containing protein [Oscillospiraceae bacterium]|jgi:LysM repeat protein|nr:DUF3794 domain-containing protein [Oscillospiraceae bacterium]